MNIHLIERNRHIRLLQKDLSRYESGDWSVSPEKAGRLHGGMIYFHETQTGPSYFGGRIVEHRVLPEDGPNAGKIVFVFDRLQEAIGVKTPREGWGMEQKTDE